MSENTYIEGVCNIGPAEIRQRRIVGYVGLVLTGIYLGFALSIDSSNLVRAGVFIPLYIATTGWLQATKKFCLAYGFLGTYNFGRLGSTTRVENVEALRIDRKVATSILLQSALYAAGATLLTFLLY